MARFIARKACQGDSPELCKLFATPMQGSISIATLREPDYFAGARVQSEKPEIFLGIDSKENRIALSGNTGKRRVFVNGSVETISYFCDLRILPAYQRGTLLPRVYKYVKENLLPANRYAQTVIVADNKAAIEALTSGRAGLPNYFFFRDLNTYSISLQTRLRKVDNPYHVRRAEKKDTVAMQKFLLQEAGQKHFLNYYEFDKIGSNDYYRDLKIENFFLAFLGNELVGMVSQWNQKAFKQTQIYSYAMYIGMLRPLVNLFAKIMGGIRLPRAGAHLNYFSLHCLLVKDNQPAIADALVQEVIQQNRKAGFDYFLTTLDAIDPLNGVFEKMNHRIFRGKHFLVSFGPDMRSRFDNRPLYFEVARI